MNITKLFWQVHDYLFSEYGLLLRTKTQGMVKLNLRFRTAAAAKAVLITLRPWVAPNTVELSNGLHDMSDAAINIPVNTTEEANITSNTELDG